MRSVLTGYDTSH